MKRVMLLLILSVLILIVNAQTFGEIGTGTTSTNLPTYALWNYSWSSGLYASAGFGGARTITQLAFNQIGTASTTLNNQKIYLKEISAASFAGNGYEDPANNGYTLVYNGPVTIAQGWVIIDITDFTYSGNNNLAVHWENRSGASNYTTNWYSTECSAGVIKCAGSDTSFPSGSGFTPYPVALPNLRFYYSSNNPATPANPIPANSATGVSVAASLNFTLGANTTGYQVWTGTTSTNLTQVVQQSISNPGNYTYTPANQWLANSQYYWKVVATNSSGSTPGSVWNFTTETVINTLPFSQGFETNFPLPGWNNPGDMWTQATYPHSGDYCAKVSYVHTGTAILQTPRIALPAAPARMKFWWCDGDYLADRIAGHDTTFCEISTNGGQSWTNLATLSAPAHQTAYSPVEVSLAPYASQNINIRFRDVTDGSFAAYGTLLDDFLIEAVPLDAFININPSNVIFAVTAVGTTRTQNIYITNQGNSPLTVSGISTDGPFSAANPGTIAPGATSTVVLSFNPVTPGQLTGSVTFNIDGAFSGNNVLQCSGEAYAAFTELYQNFDASTNIPQYWSTINITTNTTSFIGVRTSDFDAHSGTNFIKMYNAGEDTLSAKLILVTPGLNQLSNHTLTFYSKSSWGIPTDTVILGTMTNPADANTFTALQTINLTDAYQLFSYTFSNAIADRFIAFKHGLGGRENYAVYLDDISWEAGSSVPNSAIAVYPVNASINARINYANKYLTQPLNWSSGGGNPTGYRLYLGSSQSFELINNQDLGNVNVYALAQALNYNTIYYWKIVPYNTQGNAANCPVWTFTTLADPTIQITQTNSMLEGFETTDVGSIPLGWESENLNDDSSYWSTIANSTSSVNSHTGTKAIHMGFSFLSAHDDWLYTPPLQLQANNNYKLEFWYNSIPFPGEPCVEKMNVKWGMLPSAQAMNAQLFINDNITNDSYIHSQITLSPNLDGNYFVGFHAFSEPLQFVLLVDDIKVSLIGTANEDEVITPDTDILAKSYPNPFQPATTISYQLKNDKNVTIEIYNSKGQKVKTLINGFSQKGKHNLVWSGKDDNDKPVSSGMYLCRMQSGSYKSTLKLMKLN